MTPSLTIAGVAFLFALVAPTPRRASRWSGAGCALLTMLGATAIALAAILPFIGVWTESLAIFSVGMAAILFAFWLARAPERGDDTDEDSGGGNDRRPPTPKDSGPPAPAKPTPGDSVDWSDFDSLRAGWEPQRDRVLEPV